jgi:hypothetical protein
LSYGILGEDYTEFFDPGFVHEHSFIFEMLDGVANAANPTVYSSFAKSHLILSNSVPLGAENTALGAFFIQETGQPIILRDSALSDHLWKLAPPEIIERFTNFFATTTAHQQTYAIAKWFAPSHFYRANSNISTTSLHQTLLPTLTVSYTGAIFWHDHKHLDRPWNEEEPIVSTSYY